MKSSLPLSLGLLLFGLTLIGCNGSQPSKPNAVPILTTAASKNEAAGPALFEDVTRDSGVEFTYRNGEEVPHLAILESLGGGLAVIDYDGDGLLDLLLIGGGHYTGAENKQIVGYPCRLYKNLGNWKFKDVTSETGMDKLAGGGDWFYSHGAAIGDYDRDGFSDILITGWGRIALFHNESDGKGGRKFVDVSKAAGLDKGITWATSAGWADFDGDGYPDLFVGQYVDWSFAKNPACNYDGKTPDVCPPKRFAGLPSKVYRNTGKGQFEDVSKDAGIKAGDDNSSKSLGVLVVDVNLDGKPDVYVANDTVANFLYINKSTPGKILFEEMGLLSSVAMDGAGKPNGSMGVDAGDPEGTGKPSLWCTNYENEFHALYRNVTTPQRVSFIFSTESSGIGSIGQKFVGWGTGFVDLDLDGWEDIFIVNGHAIRYPTGAARRQRPVIFQNRKGKFIDISKSGGGYFQEPHLSRGMVLADFDNDGRIDVAICQLNDPVSILRNVQSNGNRWIGFKLNGRQHADIVGARVMIEAGGRTQTRFAKAGGSYASSPDRRFVFGLGTEEKIAKVTVVWPDGKKQEWNNLTGSKYYSITQDSPDIK